MLNIEIIEGCNFKCYFCPAKDITNNIYIDLELFKRIIVEARQLGITTVKLTPGRGEPFLHPNIYEILDVACRHMDRVHMFTNATAINVDKLKAVMSPKLDLHVSFYGSTAEKFVELTCTNKRLFDIFHRKLAELKAADIQHTIERRDQDYKFDYDDGSGAVQDKFSGSVKCMYHANPKIMANGDVTFCNLIRGEVPGINEIFFANVRTTPLKDALEHPMRFKFFDTQSICTSICTSFERPCHHKQSIATVKLLLNSKNNYMNNKEPTDAAYSDLERAVGILSP